MGKRKLFIALVALIGTLGWFILDVDRAEMKAYAGQTAALNPADARYPGKALCASEAAEQGLDCGQLEEKILGSTVRIDIQTWIVYVEGEGYTRLSGNGFGTVMDGRIVGLTAGRRSWLSGSRLDR